MKLSLLALVASVAAYSFESLTLRVNGADKETLEALADNVVVQLKLDTSEKPKELVVLLSNNEGLDFPLFPKFDPQTQSASVSIKASKIPAALRAQERIYVSAIAGGDESGALAAVAELIPIGEVRAELAAERLGAEREIFHTFGGEQQTVNPIVPVVFSSAAAALLVALLGTWTTLGVPFFSAPQGSTWKAGYLATIASFEAVFVRYYLGADIFTTLTHGLLIAGPFLFLGNQAQRVLSTHH